MTNLATKRDRTRLAKRHAPHFQKLGPGRALGFHHVGDGEGTWRARFFDRSGKAHYLPLAAATDFASAKEAAEVWFAQLSGSTSRTISRSNGTVREALEAYLADLRQHGRNESADEIESRYVSNVWNDRLANLVLAKVTREDVSDWRERVRAGKFGKPIAPGTANRYVGHVVAGVRAALEDLGYVGNAAAWGLKKLDDDRDFETGDTAVFLSPAERDAIIGHASAEAAVFFRAVALLGARPKEIAAATLADFDRKLGTVRLRHRKGRPAKVRPRDVVLNAEATALLTKQAKNKTPGAWLFPRADGGQWSRWDWADEFRAAVEKYHDTLKPAQRDQRISPEASAYAFRHTRISELLQLHKIDPLSVAQQTGTSVRVIETTYFKFIASAMREKLAAVR